MSEKAATLPKKAIVIMGPRPEALIPIRDPHSFRWHKILAPYPPDNSAPEHSIAQVCGVGSEWFCTTTNDYFLKFPSGWSRYKP